MNAYKRLRTTAAAAALFASIGMASAQTTAPDAITPAPTTTTTAPTTANDSTRKDGMPVQQSGSTTMPVGPPAAGVSHALGASQQSTSGTERPARSDRN